MCELISNKLDDKKWKQCDTLHNMKFEKIQIISNKSAYPYNRFNLFIISR